LHLAGEARGDRWEGFVFSAFLRGRMVHPNDYKRLTLQGLMGRIPRSRRFDVQLAGALQMPLKRRAKEARFCAS
jgi:hypothetical protein